MKVKIGVAESNRVVELEIDDLEAFQKRIEDGFSSGEGLLWFEDTKKHKVGIPKERIAFVEVDIADERQAVGFGA